MAMASAPAAIGERAVASEQAWQDGRYLLNLSLELVLGHAIRDTLTLGRLGTST